MSGIEDLTAAFSGMKLPVTAAELAALVAKKVQEGVEKAKQEMLEQAKEAESKSALGGKGKKDLPKPPKPEYYDGKRDAVKINTWLHQVKTYAEHWELSEQEMVMTAQYYLSGDARNWWTNIDEESRAKLVNYEIFTTALKGSFWPIDHHTKVLTAIEKCKQIGSVTAYVSAFELLRTQVKGIPEEIWKRWFVKGLEPKVRVEATKYCLDYPNAILPEVYQRLAAIGDVLWETRTREKEYFSYVKKRPVGLANMKPNGKQYAGQSKAGEKLTGEKPAWLANVTCYECGEKGHYKRNCPTQLTFIAKSKEEKVDEQGEMSEEEHHEFESNEEDF